MVLPQLTLPPDPHSTTPALHHHHHITPPRQTHAIVQHALAAATTSFFIAHAAFFGCTLHTQFNVKVHQSNHPPEYAVCTTYTYIYACGTSGAMHVAVSCSAALRIRRVARGEFECKPKKKHSTAPPFSWLQLIVELKTAQLCISVHIFSLSHSERVLLAKKGAVVRCAYLVLIPRVFVTCCPRSFTFCCSCCYSCLLWVTYYH